MKVIYIGRNRKNHIVLPFGNVSRRHCKIQQHQNQEFTIEDLDSTNFTWVNSKKIKQSKLRPEDTLKLAGHELDVSFLLALFNIDFPQGTAYEELVAQFAEAIKAQEEAKIRADFLKLKEVYDTCKINRRRIRDAKRIRSQGLSSHLVLHSFERTSLGFLSGDKRRDRKKIKIMNEQFKAYYVCPKCNTYLGTEPFESLERQGSCYHCKSAWVKR